MTTFRNPTRRSWIQSAGGSVLLGSLGTTAMANREAPAWQMGLIADLHYGLAPDALERLDTFMAKVDEVEPDCLLQLGDFNFGVDSEPCMGLWNQFSGPKYHVLGNHDMDKSTKTAMVERWEIPAAYYSFDHKGWHFVILDRNHLKTSPTSFTDYSKANFYVSSELRGFANPEQLEWLKEDLNSTKLPTVVFSHQGLGMTEEIDQNSAAGAIEAVLSDANQRSGLIKACFCGHHHIDRHHIQSGIHYVWINSASYYWVGAQYGRMAPYTSPLFTFLTFHPNESIEIAASTSKWAEPTPKVRGFPGWEALNTEIVGRTLD
ncbi:MAG: metallophosphoesterase family protein [Aureliella sp.]